MKEKILVSACLLGVPCRYDGRSKPCKAVIDALADYEAIPICPEESGGLKTPRSPSEIVGDRVIMTDGTDVTEQYRKGAEIALEIARENGCKTAVLKARSPSCGKGLIYDGTYTRTLTRGNGICAALLIDNGITVLDETEIEKIRL